MSLDGGAPSIVVLHLSASARQLEDHLPYTQLAHATRLHIRPIWRYNNPEPLHHVRLPTTIRLFLHTEYTRNSTGTTENLLPVDVDTSKGALKSHLRPLRIRIDICSTRGRLASLDPHTTGKWVHNPQYAFHDNVIPLVTPTDKPPKWNELLALGCSPVDPPCMGSSERTP